jgi:hypothetical protein
MPRRRLVTFTVILSVDVEKADSLVGDPGFLGPDGAYGLPFSGLELVSEDLAWSLARQAFDTFSEKLGAVVLDASSHVGDEIPSGPSEF